MPGRQNTTSKTIPATESFVLGKRSQAVDDSFPQLEKPRLLGGFSYNSNVVKSLRGYLLSNAIAEIRPAYPEVARDAELIRGRTESANASRIYWGFADPSSTSLDYYGFTGAPNALHLTIPDKTQAGKVEDEEGNTYLLASPYIPNLLIPYQPDLENTAEQIAAYESLLARTPVLEDGEPVLDEEGNPVTRRSRILTQRADNRDIDIDHNPMQTSNFSEARFSAYAAGLGGAFGAAPSFPPAAE